MKAVVEFAPVAAICPEASTRRVPHLGRLKSDLVFRDRPECRAFFGYPEAVHLALTSPLVRSAQNPPENSIVDDIPPCRTLARWDDKYRGPGCLNPRGPDLEVR